MSEHDGKGLVSRVWRRRGILWPRKIVRKLFGQVQIDASARVGVRTRRYFAWLTAGMVLLGLVCSTGALVLMFSLLLSGAGRPWWLPLVIAVYAAGGFFSFWQAARGLSVCRRLGADNHRRRAEAEARWRKRHPGKPFRPHYLVHLDAEDVAALDVQRGGSEWLGGYSVDEMTRPQLRVLAAQATSKAENRELCATIATLALGALVTPVALVAWRHFVNGPDHIRHGWLGVAEFFLYIDGAPLALTALLGLSWKYRRKAAHNLEEAKSFAEWADKAAEQRPRRRTGARRALGAQKPIIHKRTRLAQSLPRPAHQPRIPNTPGVGGRNRWGR
ncbi:hypothetical protein Srot_1029 [Segniliparus rotundus DSM 44985]|uniref:Transmembrane protein n=1 Tax=Segniliparus rotundus (strain ATCC BAA-972 / CDC 1076 / CIP 108378 / DSM 44985 / JCM 13578) TaxID=640132 RepID=D6ZEX8_SEGRD|nr:hypothetical protein [Segniliparus rotundus]ADG97502.1 hypothetical protein Srot_1029 [Segniliparus rotundus DSM 44985]